MQDEPDNVLDVDQYLTSEITESDEYFIQIDESNKKVSLNELHKTFRKSLENDKTSYMVLVLLRHFA